MEYAAQYSNTAAAAAAAADGVKRQIIVCFCKFINSVAVCMAELWQ
jgi:hypothetical protein